MKRSFAALVVLLLVAAPMAAQETTGRSDAECGTPAECQKACDREGLTAAECRDKHCKDCDAKEQPRPDGSEEGPKGSGEKDASTDRDGAEGEKERPEGNKAGPEHETERPEGDKERPHGDKDSKEEKPQGHPKRDDDKSADTKDANRAMKACLADATEPLDAYDCFRSLCPSDADACSVDPDARPAVRDCVSKATSARDVRSCLDSFCDATADHPVCLARPGRPPADCPSHDGPATDGTCPPTCSPTDARPGCPQPDCKAKSGKTDQLRACKPLPPAKVTDCLAGISTKAEAKRCASDYCIEAAGSVSAENGSLSLGGLLGRQVGNLLALPTEAALCIGDDPVETCLLEALSKEKAASCFDDTCQARPDALLCLKPKRMPPKDLCADGRCDAWKRDLRAISFEAGAPGELISYTVGGKLVAERIQIDSGSATLDFRRGPSALEIGDADTKVRIHDTPNGLISMKGDGSISITFPNGTDFEYNDKGAVQLTFGSGGKAMLRAGELEIGDNSFTASGGVAFHLVPGSVQRDLAPHGRDKVVQAASLGQIGAQVGIGKAPLSTVLTSAGVDLLDEVAEIVSYDVDVVVDPLPEVATPDNPLRVVLDADLDEGRTITIDIDPAMLPGIASGPDALELRYFDIYDDGEVEVYFTSATNLDDVLDATDDGGRPEYWVVQDQDGLQVLVSVPHWSIHAVTIASIFEAIAQPSVMVGIVVGLGAATVASFTLLRRK